VDDTPKAFVEELRSSLLKKRVGQIALAVVLAQAVWRLINALTWDLIVPLIGKWLNGNTESVLFSSDSSRPLPWENLFGSLLEFVLLVIVVFYLNRWVQRKPSPATTLDVDEENPMIGKAPVVDQTPGDDALPAADHERPGVAETAS
jgi:large-conductance mechanosensitive channel